MYKVRLVSEEFAAFVEKQFINEMLAIDLKILRSLSSRNFPSSHPLGLSLALHTARISARISQDESHLLQYLSDESSTCISDMMFILLHAAGNSFRPCLNFSCNLFLLQLHSTLHPLCARV
jgi:hypothetical protein